MVKVINPNNWLIEIKLNSRYDWNVSVTLAKLWHLATGEFGDTLEVTS